MLATAAISFAAGASVGAAIALVIGSRKRSGDRQQIAQLRGALDLYGPALYGWFWYRNACEHSARGANTLANACQLFAFSALTSSTTRELQEELSALASELGATHTSTVDSRGAGVVDLIRDAAAECAPGPTPWPIDAPHRAHNGSALVRARAQIRESIRKIASSAESAQ